jgi:hypothetical protein
MINGNQRLGRTYHLHLQGQKSAEQETSLQQVDGEYIYDKTENYFNFFI